MNGEVTAVAQVNVRINGKTYRMACDDGEEQRLADLAERLNSSIEQLRGRFGEIGDQRLTVMAALTFADQYVETARRLHEIESEIANLEHMHAEAVERQAAMEVGTATAINAVAERIESIAARISGANGHGDGDVAA